MQTYKCKESERQIINKLEINEKNKEFSFIFDYSIHQCR